MPRIATLRHNDADDKDGGTSDDESAPLAPPSMDAKVHCLSPATPSDSVVFWEYQGHDRMCALHCVNCLVQGPEFTPGDLSTIGLRLDEAERELWRSDPSLATAARNPEVQRLLTGASTNVSDDGFFSLAVLEECLKRHGMTCTGLTRTSLLHTTEDDEGFLCHHHLHWIAIRNVHGTWYNLDSLKPAPSRLSPFHLAAFLGELVDKGYTVFAIRPTRTGTKLPKPFPGTRRLQPNQVYLTDRQIDELIQMDEAYHAQALAAAASAASERPAKQTTRSPPKKKQPDTAWPTDAAGRRISERPETSKPATDVVATDPELQRVLDESLREFYEAAPPPPPEAASDAPDAITVQVRLLDGTKISRRFHGDDPIEALFVWLEAQSLPKLESLDAFTLLSQFPRREFRRLGHRVGVEIIMGGGPTSSEAARVDNVAARPFREVFQSRQEQLVMHRP